jgi:hypothetical protein
MPFTRKDGIRRGIWMRFADTGGLSAGRQFGYESCRELSTTYARFTFNLAKNDRIFHRSNEKLNRRIKYMRWLDKCHKAIHWENNLRVDLFKIKNLGYLVLLVIMVPLAEVLKLSQLNTNIKSADLSLGKI